MATKIAQRETTLEEYMAAVPRLAGRLTAATYLGPCVVQAPGAWTRIGPTWVVPALGWVVIGPGIKVWGTARGLAQLAVDADAAPQWHAAGVAVVPTPNVVYALTPVALGAPYMASVRALTTEAESRP